MRDFLRKEPPAKRTKKEFGAFYRNLLERSIGTSSSGCGTGTKSTPGFADQTKRSSTRPSEGPAGRFASSVKRSTTQLIRVPDLAARKRTNLKAGEPASCAGQSKRTLSRSPGIPTGRSSVSQPSSKLPIRLSASPSGSPEGPADRLAQQRAAKFSTSPGSRIGGPAGCANPAKQDSSRSPEGRNGSPAASTEQRPTKQLIRVPNPANRKGTDSKGDFTKGFRVLTGEPASCVGQSKRNFSRLPGIPAGRPSASQPSLKLPIRLSASPSGSPESPADRLDKQQSAKFSTSPGSPIGGCANQAKRTPSRSPEGRNGSPAASTEQRPTKQLIRVPNPANRKGTDSKGDFTKGFRVLTGEPASCAGQSKRTLSRSPGIPAGRPSASQPSLKLPIRLSASPSGSPESPADRLDKQQSAKFSTSPGSPIGGCAYQAKRTPSRSPEGPAGRPASSAGSRSTKQHVRVPNPAAQKGTDSKGGPPSIRQGGSRADHTISNGRRCVTSALS
ncbi:basic salivary proline-rich protein 2-like [Culex quinquefasciatus]|uniref:basic salivary proline-rich protein 2-like n=1 Tax=Culex quinquefasciatus TaxID=7176 RepID=UPI0018E3A34A|nr:basic salivary proline-rich protein 2-like [Culex quinquefasciatus]